jgi:RNA-directed DNA polymerase
MGELSIHRWKGFELYPVINKKTVSTHLLPYMHGFELLWHTDIPIRRLVKVQGNRSPYDGDWVYWSQRSGKSPLVSTRVATLLRRQQGKCTYCGKFFIPNDLMEVDHIIPQSKGGKDSLDHLQLLHRHCHDLKTAEDGSLGCTHDKGCSRAPLLIDFLMDL